MGSMRQAAQDGTLRLKMVCGHCGGTFKVPLALMCRAYGPGFSILGRRVSCPGHDCDGSCVVLFKWPGTNPFVSLSG